jgi:thiol-disulfide isomerase/thioredoxin
MTYTDVKPNASLEATAFEVKTPEGYKVEERKLDAGEPQPKFKEGDVAADWSLKDADGKVHSLSELKGKVVVMDFWATWCGPCKMAMPGLQNLHEKFKDKGVVVVGINVHDDSDEAKQYMTKKKFTYLSLLAGDSVADAYGVGPIPQFFVIGVDGKVIHHVLGFDPKNEDRLAEIIEKHLKEHPAK